WSLDRRVEDALLEPYVVPVEHIVRQRPVGVIAVAPQFVEPLICPDAGLTAERVSEPDGRIIHSGTLCPDAGGRHREQLCTDVDYPAKEPLLVFQLALPA